MVRARVLTIAVACTATLAACGPAVSPSRAIEIVKQERHLQSSQIKELRPWRAVLRDGAWNVSATIPGEAAGVRAKIDAKTGTLMECRQWSTVF